MVPRAGLSSASGLEAARGFGLEPGLGPGMLDRVDLGRVPRQIQEPGSSAGEQSPTAVARRGRRLSSTGMASGFTRRISAPAPAQDTPAAPGARPLSSSSPSGSHTRVRLTPSAAVPGAERHGSIGSLPAWRSGMGAGRLRAAASMEKDQPFSRKHSPRAALRR